MGLIHSLTKKQPTLSKVGSYDFVPKWSKNGQLPSSIFDQHTYSNKEWMEVFFMSGVVEAGYGAGGGFALIVVLFILLIIVGAAYVGGGSGGAY